MAQDPITSWCCWLSHDCATTGDSAAADQHTVVCIAASKRYIEQHNSRVDWEIYLHQHGIAQLENSLCSLAFTPVRTFSHSFDTTRAFARLAGCNCAAAAKEMPAVSSPLLLTCSVVPA